MNDPVGEFVEEYLERSEGSKIKVKEVLDLYVNTYRINVKPKERGALKVPFSNVLGEIYDSKNNGRAYWNDWTVRNE